MVKVLALAVLPIMALAGDMKLPAPTYFGSFPKGYSGLAVLDSSRVPYVLADTGDRAVAYAMQNGMLVRKFDIPRLGTVFARQDSLLPCGFNLTGDVDGDGIDEFIVATNRTVKKYKMLNGTLALTAVAGVRLAADSGRMWVTDGCIGDIDTDGRNEVLVAATPYPPRGFRHDPGNPVILFVCRWDRDRLVQLWNDGGVLRLELPPVDLPTEVMEAIADPRNTGTNRLILIEGTGDDVHAALFREVEWHDGRFRDDGTFWLRHGLLQRDQYDREPNNAATGCRYGQSGGKTAILADIYDGNQGREELFVFSGDTAVQHCVLWEGAQTAFLADLDGKGIGILRMPNPYEDEPSFVFYRLPSDWADIRTKFK